MTRTDMIKTKERLRRLVYERLKAAYVLEPAEIDFNYPPQAKMGDLALTFPFQWAKKVKANPRQIAQDVMSRLGELPGVERMEGGFLRRSRRGRIGRARPGRSQDHRRAHQHQPQ
jgi:arginyl-tRNA synthetase